jgi:hypothetical protein
MSAYVSKDLPALDTFTSEFTEFLIISLCWRQGWSIWHGSRLSWICSIFSSDCPRRVSQLPTVMPISNIFNHLCIADSFLNGLLCFFEDSTHARTVAWGYRDCHGSLRCTCICRRKSAGVALCAGNEACGMHAFGLHRLLAFYWYPVPVCFRPGSTSWDWD